MTYLAVLAPLPDKTQVVNSLGVPTLSVDIKACRVFVPCVCFDFHEIHRKVYTPYVLVDGIFDFSMVVVQNQETEASSF